MLLVFYVSFFFLSVVFISYDFCTILQAFNCKEPPRLSAVSTWCLYVFILFLFSSGFSWALSFLFFFSVVSFFSILCVPVSCINAVDLVCCALYILSLTTPFCAFRFHIYDQNLDGFFFLYPSWLVQLLYPSSIS